MALSNMGREPRREWVEQGFGLLVLALLGIGYIVGIRWFWVAANITKTDDKVGSFCVGLIVYAVGLLSVLGLWYLAHEFGEWACDLLKSAGLDPRPKNRPGRYD